jgi:hypothetical protein
MTSYRTSIANHSARRRWAAKCCAHCGDTFLSRGKTPIYCSDKCQRRAQNVRRQGKKHSACSICGRALEPQRSSRRYCSAACRQRAHRQLESGRGTVGSRNVSPPRGRDPPRRPPRNRPQMASGSGLLFPGPLTRTSPNKPSSSYSPTVINATPIAMSASLAIACLHRRRQAAGRWVAGTPPAGNDSLGRSPLPTAA